jgi:hypothetical protein
MALKQKISTNFGVDIDDAYHRVEQITLTSKSSIAFAVNAYKDSKISAYITNKSYACKYDITGKNPMIQAYEHLKTLPEFAGAMDC